MVKLNHNLSRIIAAICWLTAAVLATIALNELLHRSKEPVILIWSLKKFTISLAMLLAAGVAWWISVKLSVRGVPGWLLGKHAPIWVFVTLTSIWFFSNLDPVPHVQGDLHFQMIGLRQYLAGETTQFNTQVVPIANNDLAKDYLAPIIWYPPAPMWLIYPFAKAGLSPDTVAQWMIFLGFLAGGIGFLALARHLGCSHSTCLVFGVVLFLCTLSRNGLGILNPASTDCLGLAIIPWLCLATFKLLQRLREDSKIRDKILLFLLLGLGSGSLYLIKYSWFVGGAALASFLGISVFILVKKLAFEKRVILMGVYAISFFLPFFGLNYHNSQLSGANALDYNESGDLGESSFVNMIYGPNFSSTTRIQELPFSVAAAPGFILAGNILATRVVHLLRQEPLFTSFFVEELGTNAHVWALILICIPFSVLAIFLLWKYCKEASVENSIFLLTMVVVPVALLAYLSLKSGFNYIVKDNYRYILPYSLILQAILIHYYFKSKMTLGAWRQRWLFGLAFFWVCIFPGAWAIEANVHGRIINKNQPTPVFPANELEELSNDQNQSIYFFLNGHGPRQRGVFSREQHISFILDGQDTGRAPFQTSTTIRVVVAIEGNLDPTHQSVQGFLERFPDLKWNTLEVSSSLFPTILFGDMRPNTPTEK